MARSRRSASLRYRSDQAGLLLAATNVPLTFQRTLMPRNTVDQALVTGLSIASNHALVALVQESIQAGALLVGRQARGRPEPVVWSRLTLAADVAAIGAGIALQRRFAHERREPLSRAGMRTAGFWLSVSGTAGALIGGLQEAVGTFRGRSTRAMPVLVPAAGALAVAGEIRRRRAERSDAGLPPDGASIEPLKALGLGVGVAAGMSTIGIGERLLADAIAKLAARLLPGNEEVWRPLGHAAALALVGSVMRVMVERTMSSIEHKETAVEGAFDVPPPNPLVSGSLDSLVDFATLSKQGRRYAWTVTAAPRIKEVLGEEHARNPIRVYAGLGSAPTEEERVALLMAELDRTRAFERSWLLVDSPTGTGYVNYAAIAALELLSRGDCATIAMQYSARPSVLSLDRVDEGRHQARMLFDALHERLAALPEGRRPKVVLFGESLGAWTSQDPFVDRGTQGLLETGIDYAIWIGTPHFSKWKEQVLFDDRPDVDQGLIGVFNDISEWRSLDPDRRERVRYVMITHHDDGVAVFGPQLAIQAPEWLGPAATRAPEVPTGMRWMPTTTFFQVLVDMKNSATVVPGQFAAKGHDYRADLLPFFHEVLGFAATDEQLAAIRACLERDELRRTEWIKAHGATGRSMAVAVIEQAARDLQVQGLDPNERLALLVREVAEREFGAGGGASTPSIESDSPMSDSRTSAAQTSDAQTSDAQTSDGANPTA